MLHKKLFTPLSTIVFIIVLFLLLSPSIAQNNPNSLVGSIGIIFGDPMPGSNEPSTLNIYLENDAGQQIPLNLDFETAQTFVGKRIEITTSGITINAQTDLNNLAPLEVLNLQVLETVSELAALTGSQPFINLLCKFSNIGSVPRAPSQYAPLFSNTQPGLDHYWRQVSYNNINIIGTDTINTWVTLPHTQAYYTNGTNPRLNELAIDCMNAANSQVFFPDFVGINIMLNGNLGCCAWGGLLPPLNADGQTKQYRATWNPPWAQTYDVIGHEMGHAFGLPHSSGPADNPPFNGFVYVSQWDVMSASEGTCVLSSPNFNCWAPGTIAYHLDLDGWIPANRKVTVRNGNTQTLTLERIHLPVSNVNPLLAVVPINSSSNHFYTVEARSNNVGYDRNIPGDAIIIHEVLANRQNATGPALIVDAPDGNGNRIVDANDAGVMWTVGETFTDAANNISIRVDSAGATNFTVTISNNAPDGPPEITPIPNQSMVVGETLRVPVNVQDNTNVTIGYQVWAQDGRNLPAASPFYRTTANPNGTGAITFTARLGNVVDSPFNVTITAQDSDGNIDTETFQLTVNPNQRPVFQNIPDQTMQAGEVLNITPVVSDPENDPITLRMLGVGNRTPWITFNGSRVRLAPPANASGTYRIIIQAHDGIGRTWEVFNVTVEGNERPVFTPISDQWVRVGTTKTLTVMATDPEGQAITYRVIRAANLPDFITWDGDDTFTFSPRPGDQGSYRVTVAAGDGINQTWESFFVRVINP